MFFYIFSDSICSIPLNLSPFYQSLDVNRSRTLIAYIVNSLKPSCYTVIFCIEYAGQHLDKRKFQLIVVFLAVVSPIVCHSFICRQLHEIVGENIKFRSFGIANLFLIFNQVLQNLCITNTCPG